MLYTIESFYLQSANNRNNIKTYNNAILNFVPPRPQIIYVRTPLLHYAPSQTLQAKYALPVKVLNQQTNEIKSHSNDSTKKETKKVPVPQTRNPLTSDQQLESNLSRLGYRRQSVEGDGNCFFTSIASQLIALYNQDRNIRVAIRKRLSLPENSFNNATQLARALRKLVCSEWKTNHAKYKPYINDVNYFDEVRKFRSDKFYSSILGDILPLTMSNLLGLNIKIITSLSECPSIDVCPQEESLTSTKSLPLLTLAYNQDNDGHYDIAIEKEEN